MNHVTVSAVVPMYGGESTIAEALHCLREQNMDGLEILVFDDGSPDRCSEIVEKVQQDSGDERLILHHHSNRGLAGTLNRGIELAKGKYIARLDQDDLILGQRLVRQKEFLDARPEVAMVGTWARIYVGDTPSDRYHHHPTSSDALRLFLLFDNPFVHASMMIRTEVLREVGGYSEDRSRQPPEDYELWSRIARRYEVANLPKVLTAYREMPGSMSRDAANPFLPKLLRISAENLHAAVGDIYGFHDCLSLSGLYHNAGQVPRRLSKKEALAMLRLAIVRIGGPPEARSTEFEDVASRMLRHIEHRYLLRRIPGPLRSVAAGIRKTFSRVAGQ